MSNARKSIGEDTRNNLGNFGNNLMRTIQRKWKT